VVVAQHEIRTVRRVVKQLPVEMRAAVCRRALSWRNTTLDGSIPCLLFWMALHSFFFSVLQYKTWLSSQAADMLRSRLNMYVFFVYNKFFSLLALLTAHWRLLSEWPW
jgi:hypothetical protein